MYDPDDCLMISGLQHFRFCRRQWALIHIEQQWAENLRTTEGSLLHERALRGAQVLRPLLLDMDFAKAAATRSSRAACMFTR